jgi:hypothetical protein
MGGQEAPPQRVNVSRGRGVAKLSELKERARALEQQGDVARALAIYEHILKHLEGTPALQAELPLFVKVGDLALKQADVAKAVAMYDRAAEFYAKAGSVRSISALAEKIRRADPEREDAAERLTRALLKHGHAGPAAEVLAQHATRVNRTDVADLLADVPKDAKDTAARALVEGALSLLGEAEAEAKPAPRPPTPTQPPMVTTSQTDSMRRYTPRPAPRESVPTDEPRQETPAEAAAAAASGLEFLSVEAPAPPPKAHDEPAVPRDEPLVLVEAAPPAPTEEPLVIEMGAPPPEVAAPEPPPPPQPVEPEPPPAPATPPSVFEAEPAAPEPAPGPEPEPEPVVMWSPPPERVAEEERRPEPAPEPTPEPAPEPTPEPAPEPTPEPVPQRVRAVPVPKDEIHILVRDQRRQPQPRRLAPVLAVVGVLVGGGGAAALWYLGLLPFGLGEGGTPATDSVPVVVDTAVSDTAGADTTTFGPIGFNTVVDSPPVRPSRVTPPARDTAEAAAPDTVAVVLPPPVVPPPVEERPSLPTVVVPPGHAIAPEIVVVRGLEVLSVAETAPGTIRVTQRVDTGEEVVVTAVPGGFGADTVGLRGEQVAAEGGTTYGGARFWQYRVTVRSTLAADVVSDFLADLIRARPVN